MHNRRQELLNRLKAAADKRPPLPEDFLSLCFQVLYGLPAELQLRAAVHMRERYLPIYEMKVPGSTWCRQLLGDLDAWFRADGEATPDGPDDIDSADRMYQAGFTELLSGYRHRDDPACLTAAICGTMLNVIHARAQNVFLADDPVVVRLQKEHDAWWDAWGGVEEDLWPPQPDAMRQLAQPEHNPSRNVAFDAVYRREWLHVAEWLRAETVWQYPEPEDLETMMRGLERWEAHQFLPMGPLRTEPEVP
jgi:hypothetical protein